MNKEQRQLELLVQSLMEVYRIEQVIDSLPRGYISVKKIAGHVYYYRQWREGDKIISNYVPETFLKGIRQKIVIRKENEQLLKITRKDLQKSIKAVLKAGLLNEDQIKELEDGAKYDSIAIKDREEFVKARFDNPNESVKKAIQYYVDGSASYNDILLAKFGF